MEKMNFEKEKMQPDKSSWTSYIIYATMVAAVVLSLVPIPYEIYKYYEKKREEEMKLYSFRNDQCPQLPLNPPPPLPPPPLPPPACPPHRDWVHAEAGGVLVIQPFVHERFHDVSCKFREMLWTDDWRHSAPVTATDAYRLRDSDVAEVVCKAKQSMGKESITRWWSAVLLAVRRHPDFEASWDGRGTAGEVEDAMAAEAPGDKKAEAAATPLPLQRKGAVAPPVGPDVLVWLLQGVPDESSFRLWMPKTSDVIERRLGAVIFKRTNTLSYSGFDDAHAALTGQPSEESLFIMDYFMQKGYVTAVVTDDSKYKVFPKWCVEESNFRCPHHFPRAFFENRRRGPCGGETPNYEMMVGYLRRLFEVYPDQRKFFVAFHEAQSAPHPNVEHLDDVFSAFLRGLLEGGHLDNTFLVLVGVSPEQKANGPLLDDVLRARRPLIAMVPPGRWEDKDKGKGKDKEAKAEQSAQRRARELLAANENRLVFPSDVFATVRELLRFEGPGRATLQNRTINLFTQIPIGRSCTHLNVPKELCSCLVPSKPPPPAVMNDIALETVAKINRAMSGRTNECEQLHLVRLEERLYMAPAPELVALLPRGVVYGKGPDGKDWRVFQATVRADPGNKLLRVQGFFHPKSAKYDKRKFFIEVVSPYVYQECHKRMHHQAAPFCECKPGTD